MLSMFLTLRLVLGDDDLIFSISISHVIDGHCRKQKPNFEISIDHGQ